MVMEMEMKKRREICRYNVRSQPVTAERYSRLRNLFNSTRTARSDRTARKTDSFSDVMTGSSNKSTKQKQQKQQQQQRQRQQVHTDTGEQKTTSHVG